MEIRGIADADADDVLALNAESVSALTPLDMTGLDAHRAHATYAVVVEVNGGVAAFAFAYAPGLPYASINYSWHAERFDDFIYLDRIAVGVRFRRRGIATFLYDELEARAAPHGRMVCEVYSDPPNPESLAFHRGRGYVEIGHQVQLDGRETVMLEKPL